MNTIFAADMRRKKGAGKRAILRRPVSHVSRLLPTYGVISISGKPEIDARPDDR
jgi:hypothetical protein